MSKKFGNATYLEDIRGVKMINSTVNSIFLHTLLIIRENL